MKRKTPPIVPIFSLEHGGLAHKKRTRHDLVANLPKQLPGLDGDGFTPMHRWRSSCGYTGKQAANIIGVSLATYYRYESGFCINIGVANGIVKASNGQLRYRDIIGGFNPEFA